MINPNAYLNNARNTPPFQGKITTGQRVKTIYGIGIIMEVKGTFHRGASSNLDPIIATIMIPGNPPQVIYQSYQTLIFTDSAVGGELSAFNQSNGNL